MLYEKYYGCLNVSENWDYSLKHAECLTQVLACDMIQDVCTHNVHTIKMLKIKRAY